jgi:hypothetical protein
VPNARRRNRDWIGDISEGMIRTRYESQTDLANERKVEAFLSKQWGCCFHKLNPIKWKIDYLIQCGDRYSWAELKCLNIRYGQYPFMISYKKIEAAKLLHDTSKRKFNLIFRCSDELCYHTWDFSKDYKFEWGGRTTATRDSQDIEPVFRVYPEQCKVVEGFNA